MRSRDLYLKMCVLLLAVLLALFHSLFIPGRPVVGIVAVWSLESCDYQKVCHAKSVGLSLHIYVRVSCEWTVLDPVLLPPSVQVKAFLPQSLSDTKQCEWGCYFIFLSNSQSVLCAAVLDSQGRCGPSVLAHIYWRTEKPDERHSKIGCSIYAH